MVCNCKSPINGQLMSFWEISQPKNKNKKKKARLKLSQGKKKRVFSEKANKIVSTKNSEILGGSR